MPSLFPGHDTLSGTFGASSVLNLDKTQSTSASKAPTRFDRTDIFQTWSVADDAKAKAQQLGEVAVKDFEKASAAAQAKAGAIPLYSGKYYAACTFGGMLACVSKWSVPSEFSLMVAGRHPLGCNTP